GWGGVCAELGEGVRTNGIKGVASGEGYSDRPGGRMWEVGEIDAPFDLSLISTLLGYTSGVALFLTTHMDFCIIQTYENTNSTKIHPPAFGARRCKQTSSYPEKDP